MVVLRVEGGGGGCNWYDVSDCVWCGTLLLNIRYGRAVLYRPCCELSQFILQLDLANKEN